KTPPVGVIVTPGGAVSVMTTAVGSPLASATAVKFPVSVADSPATIVPGVTVRMTLAPASALVGTAITATAASATSVARHTGELMFSVRTALQRDRDAVGRLAVHPPHGPAREAR